ncbi:hypothetical protein GQ42DRAFT_154335 [Ramicandelaber brevisporus]|nr:hypothetical protein GQ42DRAFT_154335 [Ramicandelaber brevisporus]
MQIVSIFLASESYQLLDKYTHLVSTVADTVTSNQATANANTAAAASTATTTTGSTVDAPTSTTAPLTASSESDQQSQSQAQQPQLPDTFGAIRLMIGISSIMSSLGLQRVSYGFPFDDASQSQNSLWPLGTANDPSISASGNSGDESDDSADSADGSYTDDEYESSVLSEDSTETTDQAPLLPVSGNSSGEVVIGIEPDEPQSQQSQQQQQQQQRASQTDSGLQTTSNSQAVDKRLRSGIVFDLNWKTMLYAMQHNTTIMNQHQSVNNLLSDLANQPTAQQNPASNVTTSS